MERIYKYKSCHELVMTVYRILMDESHKGGWYRQITIMETFVENIMDRWYNNYHLKRKGHRCPISRADDLDIKHWLQANEYLGGSEKQCEVIYKDYQSVYEFFDAIGFDYKNKSVKQLDKIIEQH